jgi:predicted dinucleotide-binding enzyme
MMRTKQTIAVIGATGNRGATISKSLSKGNYRLLLCANEQKKVRALARQIKAKNLSVEVEEMDCKVEASWEADIIILAVPLEAEREVAKKIREMANQKIVISIASSLNNTYNGLVSAAEELQKLLPNSKVVKAFDTTLADAFITGNDNETLKIVAELAATSNQK